MIIRSLETIVPSNLTVCYRSLFNSFISYTLKDRDGRWSVKWGGHNKKVILQLLIKLHEYTFEDVNVTMKPF